ncbi:SGNH/GDSL hydrolase family protein [Companilactobacillus sp. DQM5]|uniref:SGNH/GDSL hydrolase family protein n=1 Tax=Companilactobacillus sp. DQM5 TaxID=3463359 RepID=UPI00405A2394
MKKILLIVTFILVILTGGFYYLNVQQRNIPVKIKTEIKAKKNITLVGVGDSLTHGVGDSTNNGGYVNLIKKKIEKKDNINVNTKNFGVSGETSTQIDKRIITDKNLQKSLKNADIITLTVGGNDLMHILKKYGLKLTKNEVVNGTDKFEQNLNTLIENIRRNNSRAPIYLISIYNPFGVSLKEVKYMNTAVKNWNGLSKQTATENYKVYFVDIDSLLTNPKKKVTDKQGEEQNPYLYNKDHFHPNDEGYKLITNQLYSQMIKNKDDWLKK